MQGRRRRCPGHRGCLHLLPLALAVAVVSLAHPSSGQLAAFHSIELGKPITSSLSEDPALLCEVLPPTPTTTTTTATTTTNGSTASTTTQQPISTTPAAANTTTAPAAAVFTEVLPSDATWEVIAARTGADLAALLRANGLLLVDIQGANPILPVAGTFVVTSAPPNIVPSCKCPADFPTLSSAPGELECQDGMGGSVPRLNATANVVGFATSGSDELYWDIPAGPPSASVTVDVLFEAEVFVVDVVLLREGNLPLYILLEVERPSGNGSSNASAFAPVQVQARLCSMVPAVHAAVPCVNTFNSRAYSLRQPLDAAGFSQTVTRQARITLVKEMASDAIQVLSLSIAGRCACNGHASSCWAMAPNAPRACQCQGETVGSRCSACAPLFNDKPWVQGSTLIPNPCKRCQCNNHAERCFYNASLDGAPGSRDLGGGGQCECLFNTGGNQCETCATNFFRVPRLSDAQFNQAGPVCQPCACDYAGATGDCTKGSELVMGGECLCKANVEGPICEACKAGFFNLTSSNTPGCLPCECDAQGTINGSSVCAGDATGQCPCLSNVGGRTCGACSFGFTDLGPLGCRECRISRSRPGFFEFSDPDNVCTPCHDECVDGCFGPSATECFRCRNVEDRGTCVAACPSFAFTSVNRTCEVCDPECASACTGAGPAQCDACRNLIEPASSRNGNTERCVAACPPHLYPSGSGICMPCDALCDPTVPCRGPLPTECGKCLFVQDNGVCTTACPPSRFPDAVAVCQACHPECLGGCTGPANTDCNACLNFQFAVSGACVPSCGSTGYSLGNTTCFPCDSECRQGCFGPGPGKCEFVCVGGVCTSACKNVQYRFPSGGLTCLAACPSDTYTPDNSLCLDCDPQCRGGCTGPAATDCAACSAFELAGECVSACPTSTFVQGPGAVCRPCHPQCAGGCQGPTARNCSSCASLSLAGECVAACPPQHFNDGTTCFQCNPQCLTGCFGATGSDCTAGECRTHKTLLGECVASCFLLAATPAAPAGFFPDLSGSPAAGICRPCSSDCGDHTGACCIGAGSAAATSALPGRSCGFALNASCAACDSQCLGCTASGPTACLRCLNFELNGVCVAQCPTGTFADGQVCRACDPLCSATAGCVGAGPGQCSACGFASAEGVCVAACPSGRKAVGGVCEVCSQVAHYEDATGTCQPCSVQCATACSGPGTTECVGLCANFAVTAAGVTNCTSQCPATSYAAQSTPGTAAVCLPCSPLCDGQGCSGGRAGDCVACRFQRHLGDCVAACPVGLHADGLGCTACHPTCGDRGCTAPGRAACSNCQNALDVTFGCVDACSPDTFEANNASGTFCFPCGVAGNSGRATVLDGGACKGSCPAGKHPDAGVCQPCDPSCETCDGPGPGDCTSCPTLRNGALCVTACPVGRYSDSTGVCQACSRQCAPSTGCTGPSSTECVACRSFAYNGDCRATCPANTLPGSLSFCDDACPPFFYPDEAQVCQACDAECELGCSAAGPRSCRDGSCRRFKLNGACVAECPPLHTPTQTGVCKACSSQCAVGCTGTEPSECLNGECRLGKDGDTCVPACRDGFFFAGNDNQLCTECTPGHHCPNGVDQLTCGENEFQTLFGQVACFPCPNNGACVLNFASGVNDKAVCNPEYTLQADGTCGPANPPDADNLHIVVAIIAGVVCFVAVTVAVVSACRNRKSSNYQVGPEAGSQPPASSAGFVVRDAFTGESSPDDTETYM